MPPETPARSIQDIPTNQTFELEAIDSNAALSSQTGRAEALANEDNLSFLRTTASMSGGGEDDEGYYTQASRRLRQMDNFVTEQRRQQSERESARRLRRAVLRSGMPLSVDQSGDANTTTQRASTDLRAARRAPGYQGWAPGTLEPEQDETQLTLHELTLLARGHTRHSQDTATRRHMREEELGLSGTAFGRRNLADTDQMEWQTLRGLERTMSRSGTENVLTSEAPFSESSLRTTALLQSVRRHARFPSPRSWMVNGGSERERGTSGSTRERANQTNRNGQSITRRERLDDLRRNMSSDLYRARNREEQSSQAVAHMEEAIKYLERLRYCGSDSERLSFAEEGGFVDGDEFPYSSDKDDFILDTANIAPPQQSSWLRIGSMFGGSQKSQGTNIMASFTLSTPTGRDQTNNPSRDQNSSITTPLSRSWIPNLSSTGDINPDDTWPVNVTIDSINHDTMTLTGTMEARNVPNKNAPNKESTIATYLEGEIIDFNRFTLETKSFSADPKIDSTYWRELEPFKSLSDEDLVQSVVSRKWLSEELGGKYILMRWKEKCFITPSDAQVHLTISGFYYVSLNRADGSVEGLYFDPNSSPYQHLSLKPLNREFPSYRFR